MVGQHGIILAVGIIKDHFGEIVSKVCNCLLQKGSVALQEIVRDTQLKPVQVKNCLLILIQHNCAQAFSVIKPGGFGMADKTVTLYMAIFDNIVHRLRFSKFLSVVMDDLGPKCRNLLEGLLQHGRLTFEQLLERAIAKKDTDDDRDTLCANFNTLVKAQYVERCPKPEPFVSPEDEVPTKKRDKSAREIWTLEKQALRSATLLNSERFSGIPDSGTATTLEDRPAEPLADVGEKRKALELDAETQTTILEKEVLWRANFEKFLYRLRKKACTTNKSARMSLDASVVLEAMIDSCDPKNLAGDSAVAKSSLENIFECLSGKPQGRIMNIHHVKAILDELGCQTCTEDSTVYYTIDLKAIIKDCQNDEVEALVLRKYGRDAYRIYRYLANKNQPYDVDQISEVIFVDKKEAHGHLYKLWKDNFVTMERVLSGKGDTLIYWMVNNSSLWEHVVDDMYHAASNLNQRIACNYEQDKEVADLSIEKMNEIQRKKRDCYIKRKKVLENSLLKLDDALLLFHDL